MRKLSDRFDSSGTTANGVTLTSVVPMENDKGDGIGGGGWRNRVIDTFEGSQDNKLGLSRFGYYIVALTVLHATKGLFPISFSARHK